MFYPNYSNKAFLMLDASKHKAPQKSRRETMHCLSTGAGIVLHVTGFDKTNKLLQDCNKKSVTKNFVTDFLLPLSKNTNF
jgi:hypothetical protein